MLFRSPAALAGFCDRLPDPQSQNIKKRPEIYEDFRAFVSSLPTSEDYASLEEAAEALRGPRFLAVALRAVALRAPFLAEDLRVVFLVARFLVAVLRTALRVVLRAAVLRAPFLAAAFLAGLRFLAVDFFVAALRAVLRTQIGRAHV